MSEYDAQDKPKFLKTAFDDAKMRLSAPPPKGATRPASLAISFSQNSPCFILRTNVDADEKNGFARAGMDPFAFVAVLNAIDDVINKKFDAWSIECDTGSPQERRLDAKVVVKRETDVGTGKDGSVFIGVIKKGVTPVKFYFEPSAWHRFIGADGKEVDNATRSEFAGRAFTCHVRAVLAVVQASNFIERVYTPPNGGGGYQQRNNNGGGGNNYQRSAPAAKGPDAAIGPELSFEDDMPM